MRRACGFIRLVIVSALLAWLMAGVGGAASASGPQQPVETWTCQSPDCPITINDYVSGTEDRAASPYPSDICCVVIDPPQRIDTITVTLTGLTHSSLDNVDVLLVPVSGPPIELMSDVGGGSPVAGVNLTFDDSAATSLPQNAPPPSGAYKPTNYPGTLVPCLGDNPPLSANSDPFAGPAPPPPQGGYLQTLSSLHGAGFGGFHLYVGDDCVVGSGSISSWRVDVTLIPCSDLCLVKRADAVNVSSGSPIGFTLDASNNRFFCDFFPPEMCDIHDVRLDDPLPAGPGINWSISPAYTGPGSCSITGLVGSQRLSCNFGDFPFAEGGFASVHVSSSTIPGVGCGTYSNTGMLSAADASTVQDTTSTTVTDCPTAVRLESFTASRSKRGVLVRWRAIAATGTLGFNLYRQQRGRLQRLNRTLIPSVFPSGQAYSWLDRSALQGEGTPAYRLQTVDRDGARRWLGGTLVAR